MGTVKKLTRLYQPELWLGVLVMSLVTLSVEARMGYRDVPVADENPLPPLATPATLDNTAPRQFAPEWADAPPVIPHRIEGHQIDLNANRCLTCHQKAGNQPSDVPAISPTHYVNRDGEPTDTLAGRRYFCLQCHVPQHRSELPVRNLFREER